MYPWFSFSIFAVANSATMNDDVPASFPNVQVYLRIFRNGIIGSKGKCIYNFG